jgi:hypothetical protein
MRLIIVKIEALFRPVEKMTGLDRTVLVGLADSRQLLHFTLARFQS